jgi:hypothetical protein
MIQVKEALSPTASKAFVEALPRHIQDALLNYSAETDYPVESVLEMAIAFFLDVDCAGFEDCRTETPGALRERIAILEAQ